MQDAHHVIHLILPTASHSERGTS